MNFSIDAYGCQSEQDIAKTYFDIFSKSSSKQCSEHPALNRGQKDHLQLWQEKDSYEQPGRKKIVAITLCMRYKRQLPIKFKKWSVFCYDFCCDLFGQENILSSVFINDNEYPGVVAFIYPLVGRELVGEKWLDKEGKLKHEVEKDFRHRIDVDIGHFVDEEEEKKRQEMLERAQLYPALNRQVIVEEDTAEIPPDSDEGEAYYDTISKEMAIQTDMPYSDLQKITATAVNFFTQGVDKRAFKDAIAGRMTQKDFTKKVTEYLTNHYPQLSNNDMAYIREKVLSAVFGYYVLDQLIADEDISDIKLIAWDKIRVKRKGKRYTSNLFFQSERDMDRFMEGVAIRNHIDFRSRPQSIFSDSYTSDAFRLRFDVTAPILNPDAKYYMHIRKTPKKKRSVEELIRLGMMPKVVANFLMEEVRKNSILIVGKGSAGKTTMLNQLLEWIPYDKAGVVIQESDELFADRHPEIEIQNILYSEQSPTGQEIGLKELTRAALVSDQDYIVIGEVKGGEALYAINATMTGYIFICTVHADSSQSGIDKMADYITYESSYDKETATYMLKAIKTVVFMKNFKVEEISQVVGWDDEKKKLKYEMIYARDAEDFLNKKENGLYQ